eukprot:g21705.t1
MEGQLQVKIERLSGERLEFQLPATAKISDLKLLLQETCGAPYFCQKLMWRHSLLKNAEPWLRNSGWRKGRGNTERVCEDTLASLTPPLCLSLIQDAFHPEAAKALRDAARQGDLPGAERALHVPADPNQVDDHGWTPLISAAQAGQAEVLRLLVRAAAQLERMWTPRGPSVSSEPTWRLQGAEVIRRCWRPRAKDTTKWCSCFARSASIRSAQRMVGAPCCWPHGMGTPKWSRCCMNLEQWRCR